MSETQQRGDRLMVIKKMVCLARDLKPLQLVTEAEATSKFLKALDRFVTEDMPKIGSAYERADWQKAKECYETEDWISWLPDKIPEDAALPLVHSSLSLNCTAHDTGRETLPLPTDARAILERFVISRKHEWFLNDLRAEEDSEVHQPICQFMSRIRYGNHQVATTNDLPEAVVPLGHLLIPGKTFTQVSQRQKGPYVIQTFFTVAVDFFDPRKAIWLIQDPYVTDWESFDYDIEEETDEAIQENFYPSDTFMDETRQVMQIFNRAHMLETGADKDHDVDVIRLFSSFGDWYAATPDTS